MDLVEDGTELSAGIYFFTPAESTAHEDEKLNVIFENSKQMMAILPTIVIAFNPFQSGSSLSNLEARQKALDFKLRLLVYYFNQSPPGRPPPV
ncbi:hypothetical protein WJX77_005731 [Trebouxia sp. C0004]